MAWTKPGRRGSTDPETLNPLLPKPATASATTWCQAWLDRIASPPETYFRSFVKWYRKITSDPRRYTTQLLTEQLCALGPEIAALQQQRTHPPETLTGSEWTKLDDLLKRREGMLAAVEFVLAQRQRLERASSTRVPSAGNTPPPISAHASATPTLLRDDPFAFE